jgi:site-specific DNA recombinase
VANCRTRVSEESGMGPEHEHLRVPAEELRIISDDLWNAAHAAMAANAARATGGRNPHRPGRIPGLGGKYLLTGLMTCSRCGGGIEARSRSHGGRRLFFYGCSTFQRKGEHVCDNKLTVPMEDANKAVLDVLEDTLLCPDVIDAAIHAAVAQTRASKNDAGERLRVEVERLELQLQRLSDAIAQGGEVGTLIPANTRT